MTNDAVEITIKGGGVSFTTKIAPGDVAEAEKARRIATFILDLVADGDGASQPTARRTKRSKADAEPATAVASSAEEEVL